MKFHVVACICVRFDGVTDGWGQHIFISKTNDDDVGYCDGIERADIENA